MTESAARATAHFSGRVQGVGFRFATRSMARNHPVTGFVRNLRDGRVELVAEGARESIEGLLAEIAREMKSNIAETSLDWSSATGEFADFSIQR